MHRLIKASSPGWEKEFGSAEEARAELLSHICGSCLSGEQQFVGEGGTMVTETRPAPNPDDIHDLLATPCGCEYWYEPPESADAA